MPDVTDVFCYFSFSIAHSLRHKPTGKCLHLYGGAPVDGIECCLWQGCDEERTKVTFMKQGAVTSWPLIHAFIKNWIIG